MSENWPSINTIIEAGTAIAEGFIAAFLWPELSRYLEDARTRRERIHLNLEVLNSRYSASALFGLESLIQGIDDLIDHAKNPEAYSGFNAGNEILIVGPRQSGKKALALYIANCAGIRRVIIVHDLRDAVTLARAKNMIENRSSYWQHAWGVVSHSITMRQNKIADEKTMLLLPGLDFANKNSGEVWYNQLEALVETASMLPHVLIVGTANTYDRDGEVASWFGTVLQIPRKGTMEWTSLINEIAYGYLDLLRKKGYDLSGISSDKFVGLLLQAEPNPAEIKDIFANYATLVTYRSRAGVDGLGCTEDDLRIAIHRVIPSWGEKTPSLG